MLSSCHLYSYTRILRQPGVTSTRHGLSITYSSLQHFSTHIPSSEVNVGYSSRKVVAFGPTVEHPWAFQPIFMFAEAHGCFTRGPSKHISCLDYYGLNTRGPSKHNSCSEAHARSPVGYPNNFHFTGPTGVHPWAFQTYFMFRDHLFRPAGLPNNLHIQRPTGVHPWAFQTIFHVQRPTGEHPWAFQTIFILRAPRVLSPWAFQTYFMFRDPRVNTRGPSKHNSCSEAPTGEHPWAIQTIFMFRGPRSVFTRGLSENNFHFRGPRVFTRGPSKKYFMFRDPRVNTRGLSKQFSF